MSDTRQLLINTAKELLWERGYEAMSPNQVLQLSGVGKGSLYHHFSGKKALVQAAIKEIAEEMKLEFENDFFSDLPLPDRLESFLKKERDGTKGCRLGRIAFDLSIKDEDLRAPIHQLFQYIESCIIDELNEADRSKTYQMTGGAENIAAALIATIQGGFTLSRIYDNPSYITKATEGAVQMLHNSLKKVDH